MSDNICLFNRYACYGDEKSDVFEISKKLNRIGFEVTVICCVDNYTVDSDYICYIPVNDSNLYLSHTRFKYLVCFNEPYGLCLERFDFKVMLTSGCYSGQRSWFNIITHTSYYHRDILLGDVNSVKLIPYIQDKYFNSERHSLKENKMLWCSNDENSLKFLVENIFPIIKSEVSDFEIDVIDFGVIEIDAYNNIDGVNVIKGCTDNDIFEIKKRCKLFIYPNICDFYGEEKPVCDYYKQCIENALCGNVVVTGKYHGINEILVGYDLAVDSELFIDGVLSEEFYGIYSKALANEAIRVLQNEEYRKQKATVLREACNQYKGDNFISNLVSILNNGFSRCDFSSSTLKKIKMRLVFHFWIPSNRTNFYNELNELHLSCLERYSDRFNESVFVLSCDNENDTYVEYIKKRIMSYNLKGSIYIKVVQNDSVNREGKTYNDEILHKLDKLDGLTFFGHNKGTSRVDSLINDENYVWYEELRMWVTFMYYMNLEPIKMVKSKLTSPMGVCYGTMLSINNNPCYYFNDNNWCYMGAFHWLNTQKLYDLLGCNKKGYDSSDAEQFLPTNLEYKCYRVHSYNNYFYVYDFNNLYANFFISKDFFYDLLKSQTDDDVFEEYLKFHNSLVKE